MCLVAWPLNESEAGGDHAVIETQWLSWLSVMMSCGSVAPRTGSSLGCAPGCDAGGREFETPTGPTLRVFK